MKILLIILSWLLVAINTNGCTTKYRSPYSKDDRPTEYEIRSYGVGGHRKIIEVRP